MATIYDIAELCKTSVATVSYVLNGNGDARRISKATQEKVLAAAERVSYRPNVTARQLKSAGRPNVRIAAFWPEFYFEQSLVSAMRAIKNVSRLTPEAVEVSVHFFTPDSLFETWDKFDPHNYNGIILAGASMKDLGFVGSMQRAVPVVLVNRTYQGFPSVSIDHRRAGQLACELSYKYGGSEICAVWDSRFHVATNLRRTAFAERCKEFGIDMAESQYTCEGSSEDGYRLGLDLIRKNALKRVLYCNNESVSRGLLTAMNESGIIVGKDVLLLTANNGPDSFCRFMTPSVSEIDLRMQEVFEQGLKLCLNIVARNEDADAVTVIQPKYVFRESMPDLQ